MTSQTTEIVRVVAAAASTDDGDTTPGGHGLNSGLISLIPVLSLAGISLVILSVIVCTMLWITKGNTRIREYSAATRATNTNKNNRIHNDTTAGGKHTIELKTDSETILVNNNPLELSVHAAVVQQLQCTFSKHLQKGSFSVNSGETGETDRIVNNNSTSTNTTIMVDIEDDGKMEETVFMEKQTESGVEVVATSHLLHQPSQNCVPICGRSSNKCLEANMAMSLLQCKGCATTGSGCTNNHGVNQKEPGPDSPHFLVGRCAFTHTREDVTAAHSSLSQPQRLGCNSDQTCGDQHNDCISHDPPSYPMSHDYLHDYVNVPTQSLHNDSLYDSGQVCTNDSQLQTPSEISNDANHACACTNFTESSSLPLLRCQVSSSAEMEQTDELVPAGSHNQCHVSDPGYVNVPNCSLIPFKHQKSATTTVTAMQVHMDRMHDPLLTFQARASQLRPLPPRKVQTVTTDSCFKSSSNHDHIDDSDYEDASSQSPMSWQRTSPTTTWHACGCDPVCSSKPGSSSADDHGYVNMSKPRSVSQPNPVATEMFNLSLIPPRTIPRVNFSKDPTASCQKSVSNVCTPPHFHSKSTQHVHSLQPCSVKAVSPLLGTNLPAKTQHLASFTGIESKSSSGCSSGSSDQLHNAEGQQAHANGSKQNHVSFPEDRRCSCDSVGNTSYVVNNLGSREMSESVESLDIWPPVIPRHTELMFIVARDEQESQKDHSHSNSHTHNDMCSGIKMSANKSYVKR